MAAKGYMSNILRVWTAEAQETLLAQAGAVTIYRDELKARARRARDASALTERTAMLRPTGRRSRDETIYVACLGVLAMDLRDLGRCFAASQARGATIVALNTGRRIGPDARAKEIAAAQEDFAADKRRGAVSPGRRGYEAAKELRDADTKRRIDLIREDWGNPRFSTLSLLARAGRTLKSGAVQPMAWVTARKFLPDRRRLFKQKRGIEKAKAARTRIK